MVRGVRAHIRSNVVGYVALFLALSGGTAYALDGSNTVFSDDIVNGEVKTADLAGGAATNPKLAGGAVNSPKVADNSLTGADVQNGSLGTAEFAGSIPAVHVTQSAGQSIPSRASTTLAFNSERYDTAAMHENKTNNSRLTAPVNGIYAVSAQIVWVFSTSGSRSMNLLKNDATNIAIDTATPTSSASAAQEVTIQVQLQAGDYVEVRVAQNSGGPLSVVVVPQYSPEFSMTWLAPGP